MFKGICNKNVIVKSEPLEDAKYNIGDLKKGDKVEIDVKEFDYYLIKYNDGFAYVKENEIDEV